MAKLQNLKEVVKKQAKKGKSNHPPRHERVQVSRMAPPNQPMKVRILGPTNVFASEYVKSLLVNLPDGKMSIHRRYSSVIEKLKEGEIKLKLAYPENSVKEKKYHISSGWMITSYNLCEILVKKCKEITSI
ncbi:ATP synthase F1 subunit epsilon [Mycoplasma ovis str. Michigan]|uniref:ATP synthase F1 subunit epsilon n=1 Tax=Mycoplasma ovis str. Michigan TaxID=1415773 RepID=A0ABM5P0Q8_9MOLU|nr:ATP synthase F1 subunit epsilon [Mycoplasma ovis]AHC40011.1 ATP synthase F1 subunit epsilon [Mycoplasma ovis str. Michigan]